LIGLFFVLLCFLFFWALLRDYKRGFVNRQLVGFAAGTVFFGKAHGPAFDEDFVI